MLNHDSQLTKALDGRNPVLPEPVGRIAAATAAIFHKRANHDGLARDAINRALRMPTSDRSWLPGLMDGLHAASQTNMPTSEMRHFSVEEAEIQEAMRRSMEDEEMQEAMRRSLAQPVSEANVEWEDYIQPQDFDTAASLFAYSVHRDGEELQLKVCCPNIAQQRVHVLLLFNGCEVVVESEDLQSTIWQKVFHFHPQRDGLWEFKGDHSCFEDGVLTLVFHQYPEPPRQVFRFPEQNALPFHRDHDPPSQPLVPPGPQSLPSDILTAPGRLEGNDVANVAYSVHNRAETSGSAMNTESIEEVRAQVGNEPNQALPVGRAESVIQDFDSFDSASWYSREH